MMYKRQQEFGLQISNLVIENKLTDIYVNVYVASVLRDYLHFENIGTISDLAFNKIPYTIGKINGANIMVDRTMKWNDHRVLDAAGNLLKDMFPEFGSEILI